MAEGILDIFNDDAFSVTNLTDAINELTYTPGHISELGIFTEESVDTTTIAIEKKGNIVIVVPPSPRGGVGTTVAKEKRDLLPLAIPHFEIIDAIMAEEVQGVRAFGRGQQLMTVAQKIAQRQNMHVMSMAVTEEAARLGAVQGIITYADGSQLNLYTQFGVSKIDTINFDLTNATPASGALRRACAAVIRMVANELGGVPFRGLRAQCGDNFFDALLAHKEVRDTYKNWNAAQILRDAYIGPNRSVYGIFEFGGIIWENYRGSDSLDVKINTNHCAIFPEGVPGLFRTVYAPADYEDTVNTMGQRLYNRIYPMENGKGRNFSVQMNALQYCTRPRVLLDGKRAAADA